MAMREIAALPDKALVECWLTEGANFADRLWDTNLVVHQMVEIEMDTAHVNGRLELQVPMTVYLQPDPAHPNATWSIHAGMPVARRFSTPSGNLEPNDVSINAKRVAWVDTNGEYDEADPAEVTITRGAGNVVSRVTRKVAQ